MNPILQFKSNRLVRSFIQRTLESHISRRKYRESDAYLHFPADKHLNLFFARYASTEPALTRTLLSLMKPDALFFDVGSNIGFYSILLSTLHPNARIVAVEPDPGNLAFLYLNVFKNHCTNVHVVSQAVSRIEGKATFFQDLNSSRTSSLSRDVFHPAGRYGLQAIEVQTTTLDTLSSQFGFPDCIKCDIEGHEIDMLEGGTETLTRDVVLVLEVKESNRTHVSDLLHRAGFLLYNADQPIDFNQEPVVEICSENILAIKPDRRLKIKENSFNHA